MAVGTCAAYGGIHAMAGNPTGAMGVPDYLGWEWRSKAGLPIVCVPGCPTHPDNLSETILHLLYQISGQAPTIAARRVAAAALAVRVDRALRLRPGRPTTTRATSPPGTGRRPAWSRWGAGARWCGATSPSAGWINGVGGCPNVGGICIGCTMPGFPDKFMPFMETPAAGAVPSGDGYAPVVQTLRGFTVRMASDLIPYPLIGRSP